MSTVPVVSFWNSANDAEVPSWDIGVINANSASPELNLLVWNNRAGIADVSDMQDCKITVLDDALGEGIPMVTEKWVGCRCISAGEVSDTDESYTRIGGNDPVEGDRNTKDIKALDQDDFVIKGTANTGAKETDTANFADLGLKLFVPLNATAGAQAFKLRVSYFYT